MVFLMKAVDICSDLRHTEAAAFISSPGLHWVDNAAQTGWGCRKNVKDTGGRIIEGSGGQRGGSGSSLLSTWEEKGDFGAVDCGSCFPPYQLPTGSGTTFGAG